MSEWTCKKCGGRYGQNYCQACAAVIAYPCSTCGERFSTPEDREAHTKFMNRSSHFRYLHAFNELQNHEQTTRRSLQPIQNVNLQPIPETA